MSSELKHEMCDISLIHLPKDEAFRFSMEEILNLGQPKADSSRMRIYSQETGIIRIQSIVTPENLFVYAVTACLTDDAGYGLTNDGIRSNVEGTIFLRHLNEDDLILAKENTSKPSIETRLDVYFGEFQGKDMSGRLAEGNYAYTLEQELYKFNREAFPKIKKDKTIPMHEISRF